ncbi:MAG: hypothetical protein JOZ90_14575 [Alphaproteobacteria bacterium]|nr:hypothetical protein [Alphaproteobacteria bacterium]MBV9372167.1 hypothetical protein [Alphaproteobacteria bacterium]MBV9902298.1 hypothetical protein [Alphaproteobacteria bacterium]
MTDLAKLRDSVISRVRNLSAIVGPIKPPLSSVDRQALAFVTIELDNLVIVGLRQYTKSSLLRSRTAAGDRITANVSPNSVGEAAALIFSSLNPAKYVKKGSPVVINEEDEIAFRDPKQAEKVLLDYAASNIPNFALALSLNALIFSELKTCRHFFAHRARNTFENVRDFAALQGIANIEMPERLLVHGRPTTGTRFLDGWLGELETFFDLAA